MTHARSACRALKREPVGSKHDPRPFGAIKTTPAWQRAWRCKETITMKTMRCAWCKRTISLRGATGKPYRHNNEGALCYGSSQDVKSHDHIARAEWWMTEPDEPPVPAELTISLRVWQLGVGMIVVDGAKRLVVTKDPWPSGLDTPLLGGPCDAYVVRVTEMYADRSLRLFRTFDETLRGGNNDPVSVELESLGRRARAAMAKKLAARLG